MADMKENISVSLEKDTITWLDKQAETGQFRNRSHVIEYAINELKKRGASQWVYLLLSLLENVLRQSLILVWIGSTKAFSLLADLAVEVLQEMKCPGCDLLYILEAWNLRL